MSDIQVLKTPRYAWLTALAATVLYAMLALHLPVGVLASADYDDNWFFVHARALVAGHWLGPYNQTTLIKGPGYTVFLALNYLLGLPVTLSQALLYAGACALFSHAVFRLTRSAPLGVALFLLTLWHPSLFPTRLVRDDIYGAESLLYFACLIRLLLIPAGPRARMAWAAMAGLSLAWTWMTREEGVWLLAPTAVICAAGLWRNHALIRPTVLFGATAILAWCVVASCNLLVYHTFLVVDFKSRAYSRAVAALQSVRVGEPVPYVPVPEKVREKIYAVSPAFASLRPYFDGDGRNWIQPGCQIYPATCGDYAGGWFIWAFRDAAASVGRYGSPSQAAAFYDQITREVQGGCRDGRLRCVASPMGFIPAITAGQRRQIPAKLGNLAGMILARESAPSPPASDGRSNILQKMWDFEGFPRRTPADSDPTDNVVGWFHTPSNTWLQLGCTQDGRSWAAPVNRSPSPDLVLHFKDPNAANQRFTFKVPTNAQCRVQLAGAAPSDGGLTNDQWLAQRNRSFGGGELSFDDYGAAAKDVADAYAHRAEHVVAALYGVVMPLLVLSAALGYLAHLVLLARGALRIDRYWWLTHALWLGAAGRLLILLLVDISAFPALVLGYVAATLPLISAALLMTLYLPFRAKSLSGLRPGRLADR